MQAKTFTIIGIRLLAALSLIRTINSISLWTAEQHGHAALSITGGSLLIASIPVVLGLFLWIYAPKLVALFGVGSDATFDADNSKPSESGNLLKKEDFLTIGLVTIGTLILMNAIPTILITSAEWLFAAAPIDWLILATPAIKIALCVMLIANAKKLSGYFLAT